MLPEVQTFNTAWTAADKTAEDAFEVIEGEYDEDKIDYDAYRARRLEVADEQNEKRSALLAALKKATTDPLILWMLENTAESFPEESQEIFRRLPATADELFDFGMERWCNTFRTFYMKAEKAGVLPAQDMSASAVARRELHRYLRSVTYTRELGRARITELLQNIIVAETTAEDVAPQD